MHWIQDEQPIEYHVIQWRNSAFHNHDKLPKRKMLGGVSFDGGAGGGGKGRNIQQAGVQTAQPSFPHIVDENLFGCGIAEKESYGKKGDSLRSITGTKTETGIRGKDRDTVEVGSIQEAMAVCRSASADEGQNTAQLENAAAPVPEEKRNRPAFLKSIRKFGNGIQTFLREMEQKAGRENSRKQPKKEKTGTRPVTKEELARIQADRTYLLDSYNKYGERSTLGR